MRPGGRLGALHDVAGKAAEQAARIAGALAIVDAPASSTISEAAMTRGCNLMRWYLDEALRLAEAVEVAQEVEDAQVLLDWLHKQAASHVTATTIQKSGPNRLRQKARMDPAIEALEAAGWLKVDDTSHRAWRVHPKPRKPQPQPPEV
jgi:hypothetical protein